MRKRSPRGTRSENSNRGRNRYRWHPFWLWQILRRNKDYQKAVDDFVAQIAPDQEQMHRMSEALSGRGDIEAEMENHSYLYEIFSHIQDYNLSWSHIKMPSHYRRLDRGLSPIEPAKSSDYDEIIEDYLVEVAKEWEPSQVTSTMITSGSIRNPKDLKALKQFRALYGDVLTFPIPYEVEFPEQYILFGLIRCHPVRVLNTPSGSIWHEEKMLDVISSPEQLLISIDPSFSDGDILDRLKALLSAERKTKRKLTRLDAFKKQFQGDNLYMKLKAFDHAESLNGLNPDWKGFCQESGILPKRYPDVFLNTVRMWPQLIAKKVQIFDIK